MRQWIRSRLTYANVMVTILAFIVVGGGTALASFVISSNGQVGPGTISGHKPPTGAHSNVIAGSLNGQDVAGNSLGGADIDESSLLLSNIIARPVGATLSAGGLTTASATPYPLVNATFTQKGNEIDEFVTEVKASLAAQPGDLCQVQIDLNLDGQPLATARSVGTDSTQLATKTVALRQALVLPRPGTSTQHHVTATARLADHSGSGFTDACSGSSQLDNFALDVIGTR